MKASKTRNLIAIIAIALTTLLFTTLFTIGMSVLSSYEEHTFRQIGGYSHGSFKDVDSEQIEALSANRKVKKYGFRTICGVSYAVPFAKIPAEISWMDSNTAKWSYATPTVGRMPVSGMEIAMDTAALKKLGIMPELGAQVELTYKIGNGYNEDPERTDIFTLVGFWTFDPLMRVHYINVTYDYAENIETQYIDAGGSTLCTDMNVMLTSGINIESVMESIAGECGYQWENKYADNYVRISSNWGYTGVDLKSSLDPITIAIIGLLLLLIALTGYLVIYNIFQIAVTNDIRAYGLLKVIGTTPRQLGSIVRLQALYLSVVGIPIGCLLGYGVGAALLPALMSSTDTKVSKVSASPIIFLGAAAFALITVMIACAKPARKASRITPMEGLRYTEGENGKKKTRATHGAGIAYMSFANLGRGKGKTVLVVLSLSLAVVMLNCVCTVVGGFNLEKYISSRKTADFLVASTDYFNSRGGYAKAGLSSEIIKKISESVNAKSEGTIIVDSSDSLHSCWVSEEAYRKSSLLTGEAIENDILNTRRRGELLEANIRFEGFAPAILDKLTIYDGSLEPLFDQSQRAIAVANIIMPDGSHQANGLNVGDILPVTYIDEGAFVDVRTGELADDSVPFNYIEYRAIRTHEVEYTVCAVVGVPYSLSFRSQPHCVVEGILIDDTLRHDWAGETHTMLYAFDTSNEDSEKTAEAFLADYTAGDASGLMYESKAIIRAEFKQFRSMFLLFGAVLCFIVGLVGVLNFFNTIFTGIITRKKEFATLRAVGMTGKQLNNMLVYEGIFYAAAAGILSLLLSMIVSPLLAKILDKMFWFFSYRFTILPALIITLAFLILGTLIPMTVYCLTAKKSVIEQLREVE